MSNFFKKSDLTRNEAESIISDTLKKCDDGELYLENSKSVKKLFSDAKKKLGKIHHLINCASLFENDDLLKFNEKSWNKHININAKAPAILISNFANQKLQSKDNPTITNILDQRVFKLTPYFFHIQ